MNFSLCVKLKFYFMFLTICSFHFTGFISSMLILCKYSHFHFLLISNNMRNLVLIPIFMRYKTPLNYMQLFLAGLKVDRFDFHNKGLYLLLPPSLSLSYNLFLRSFSFFIKGKAKQTVTKEDEPNQHHLQQVEPQKLWQQQQKQVLVKVIKK